MRPTPFIESTLTLGPPPGMTEEECGCLEVHRTDDGALISRWEPSEVERQAILDGRPVWLWVWGGGTQPPVYLGTEHPFAKKPGATPKPLPRGVGLRIAIRTEDLWVVAYAAQLDTMDGAERLAIVHRNVLESVPGAFDSFKGMLNGWLRRAMAEATGQDASTITTIEQPPPPDA